MTAIKIHARGLGKVTYKQLGSLSARQLNTALGSKTISTAGEKISLYNYFNENSAAADFKSTQQKAVNGVTLYKIIYKTTIPENN